MLRPCLLRGRCPFRTHVVPGTGGRSISHRLKAAAAPQGSHGEDLRARWKALEEEAARLRRELAVSQATKGTQDLVETAGKLERTDSVDYRDESAEAAAAEVSGSQETRVWLEQQKKYMPPKFVCYRPGGGAIPDLPVGVFDPVLDEIMGLFKEALDGSGEPLSQLDCEMTSMMCTEMVEGFEDEADRMRAFTAILQDYVGVIINRDYPNIKASRACTDGTTQFMTIIKGKKFYVPGYIQEVKLEIGTSGDPFFQLLRYYQMYLMNEKLLELVKHSVLPVLSVELVGPLIRVSVLASLEDNRVVCEPLTPYLHLYPMTVTQPDHMDRVARVLRAVKIAITLIEKAWQPGGSLVVAVEHAALAEPAGSIRDPSLKLPYPLRPESGFGTVELLRSETWKRIFGAKKDSKQVVVKFARLPEQAVCVHRAWAAAGLAPKIYEERRLACGWTMLVMERLEPADGWIMFRSLTQAQKQQLNNTVLEKLREAHNINVDGGKGVHGDMRQANVMIQLDDNKLVTPPQVRFLDFDWSGLEGKARLPAFARERLQGCGSGVEITQKYDERLWQFELEEGPL